MRLLRYLLAPLLLLTAMTACSSGGSDSGASQADSAVDSNDAGEMEAPVDAEPEGQNLDDEGIDIGSAQMDSTSDRDIIYTAELHVSDPDPIQVAEDAWATASSYDGFVTRDERDRGERWAEASMTIRIPSEHFQEAMDELAGLAEKEQHRSASTEDVTETVIDLDANIATQRASVNRVRELLDGATSVSAILELESELARREGALASLESKLANLQDQVALSTITFTVITPDTQAPEEETGYTGPASFSEGIGSGWAGVLGVLTVIAVVLGFLLPFLPVVALVLAAVFVPLRLARRRRGNRGPIEPQPAAPSSAGPSA